MKTTDNSERFIQQFRLREVLRERGMTQAELAKRMNIQPISLSQSINRCKFTVDRLSEMAGILDVPISYLFTSSTDNIIEIEEPCKRFKIVPID